MDVADGSIVPAGEHCGPPIAEQMQTRKKMQVLEDGINGLRKSTRQQQEVVLQLEGSMQSMITDLDLKRAIGLTFQEFECRLQDAFQESNQKFLVMFSKKEEVAEVQSNMTKKVNWTEYNSVLKKLSELRAYIDNTAQSVFVGHRDALNQEFARKADATMVDLALKSKADVSDMSEVRARLERLEILFSHSDAHHREKLEELRDDLTAKHNKQVQQLNKDIKDHSEKAKDMNNGQKGMLERLASAEGHVVELRALSKDMKETLVKVEDRQANFICGTLGDLTNSVTALETCTKKSHDHLQALARDQSVLYDDCKGRFAGSDQQSKVHGEQIEFLMQAAEMLKRRLRETGKSHTAVCKELTEGQESLSDKLSALERTIKQHQRDVKSIGDQTLKGAGLRALQPVEPPNPTVHLKSVLDQLERIAADPVTDKIPFDPNRPPLPAPHSARQPYPGEDPGMLPSGGLQSAASVDAARAHGVASNVRGMYGLSPRAAPAPKPGKKKEKR